MLKKENKNNVHKEFDFKKNIYWKQIQVGFFKEYHSKIYFRGGDSVKRKRNVWNVACALCFGSIVHSIPARNFLLLAQTMLEEKFKRYFMYNDFYINVAQNLKLQFQNVMKSNIPPPLSKKQSAYRESKGSSGITLLDTGFLISQVMVKVTMNNGEIYYI